MVAALFVPAAATDHLLTSVRSLHSERIRVAAGGPSEEALTAYADAGCECYLATDRADLMNQVWTRHHLPVLAVGDAVILPSDFLGPAIQLMEDDIRVATVSFFSNDAGFLSYPLRNDPIDRAPQGHDAASVTRLLRDVGPHGAPTPIPTAVGAAVLLSPAALGAVGPFVSGPHGEQIGAVADFSARARAKGFLHLLDESTYFLRHRMPGDEPLRVGTTDDLDLQERHWIFTNYPNEVDFVDHEAKSPTSPLALAHGVARVKVLGLRLVVDGSYLGPHEMGTQVSILATVKSLSQRADVRQVVVALRHDIPPYATEILSMPKVVPRIVDFDTLEGLDQADVAHRLTQPDQWFSVDRWRTVADRVIVTVLDIIAYQNGAYHDSVATWLAARQALRAGTEAADAVVVISEDVKLQMEIERFPVEPQRLHAIPFGTEYITGQESDEIPSELISHGFIESPFVLCLGTDYAHKNRDVALAVVAELRRRGLAHALVMAGPSVPHGSSRVSETRILASDDALNSDVHLLSGLPSAERNWLLRHADLVLYPSSAEGFGLVPFEAARFGTPTVFTSFGPLRELAPDIPVAAKDWSPSALADAAESLLRDPALARAQVASCLAAGAHHTWSMTANRLTDLYRHVMALAPR